MDKSIYLLLSLLPFAYWKPLFSPYEIPKTWILLLAASISVGVYLYRERQKRNVEINNRPILLFVILGLWGWLIITSIVGGDFVGSWMGNSFRRDGLLTLSSMIILGLSLRIGKELWSWIGWGNLIMSVLTIVWQGMPALLMGNVNLLAGYLAVTLPITQRMGWVAVAVQILALLLLKSWGGILCTILYLVIVGLWKRKKLMIVLMGLVLVGVVWQYQAERERLAVPGIIVAESRERIWMKSLIAIYQRPILGWGWAQYSKAFQQIDYPEHYKIDAWVDRTHASLTEYAVAGGVPALLMYAYVVGASVLVLMNGKREEARMMGVVALLYVIHSQTNVTSVAEDWLLFVAIGEAIRIQTESYNRETYWVEN